MPPRRGERPCPPDAAAYGAMHPKGTCSASLHCVGIAPYTPPTEIPCVTFGRSRPVRPYTRLPHPHFVLILSFRASAHTGVGIRIPAPAGAESPKPPLCKGRCRPQGDGGIVIAGRGRAPPLHTFIETCTHGGVWSRRPTNYLRRQNIPNQRPKAATYLCRSAAKARFDNRPPPEGVSKEGGPQPSLFGRSRMGDFQGGRKIETSFPLEWRFWLLLSLLTKVTRRRQKKKNIPGGQTRPPLHTPTAHRSFPVIPSQCSHWRGNPHPRARRRGLPKTHQDLRPRRRSCPQFSYNISRATGR